MQNPESPKSKTPSSEKPVVGSKSGQVLSHPALAGTTQLGQPTAPAHTVPDNTPAHSDIDTKKSDPKPLASEDRFKVAYGEMGNQIRHFSTVRSSLTTFLITVSLAALAANANREKPSAYLINSGIILMGMALIVCLRFSYQTEKHVLRYRDYWNWAKDTSKPFPDGKKCRVEWICIWGRMLRDPMNWLAAITVYAILGVLNVPLSSFPLRRLLPW